MKTVLFEAHKGADNIKKAASDETGYRFYCKETEIVKKWKLRDVKASVSWQ